MVYFLFGALQQFYFDGSKRTSRFMMNGILMTHGIDAISVPAARLQDFNEKMVSFYRGEDGTEMILFLIDCQSKQRNLLEVLADLEPLDAEEDQLPPASNTISAEYLT